VSRFIFTGGNESNHPIGYVAIILSQLIYGGLYIIEEKLLSKYYVPPTKVVGLEGLAGVGICIFIMLPILSYIPCSE